MHLADASHEAARRHVHSKPPLPAYAAATSALNARPCLHLQPLPSCTACKLHLSEPPVPASHVDPPPLRCTARHRLALHVWNFRVALLGVPPSACVPAENAMP